MGDCSITVESECALCKRQFARTGENEAEMIGVFVRGYAEVAPNEDKPSENVCVLENVKFSRMVCEECFLTDPDLCRFFNKIGCQMR